MTLNVLTIVGSVLGTSKQETLRLNIHLSFMVSGMGPQGPLGMSQRYRIFHKCWQDSADPFMVFPVYCRNMRGKNESLSICERKKKSSVYMKDQKSLV